MFWDILSTFVNVAASFQEGTAATRAAKFNANIARYNANTTRESGVIEESRVRREARQRIGLMKAQIGASGLEGGSADDLLADSLYQSELDALTTRFNYSTKARSYEMQGSLYDSQAKDAKSSMYLSAASSLLKGGTNYYGRNADLSTGKEFKLGGGSAKANLPWLNEESV